VRCPRCGNENSEGNRFCGMCGASLIATAPAAAAPAASRAEKKPEPANERSSDEPRLPARPVPAAAPEPSITGPSFLGLNKPDNQPKGGRGLHRGSVDYLLDDDEEETKSGWGKIVLVLIALVLAGGFGYLHWRQGGFDWVLNSKKPAAAENSPDASAPPASNPTTADSGANNAAPTAASGNSATQPAAGNTAPTSTENSAAPTAAAPSASTNPAPASTEPPANAAPAPAANTAQTPPSSSTSPTPAPDKTAASAKAVTPAAEKSPEASSDDSDNSESDTTAKPTPAPKKLRKPTPATPIDVSAEAERYIYGRGVPQDCDRGLHLLKSASQYDPKAMVTMGVLYSSGTCAPRDLPTAYRWFAMALHKDPNNKALQDDLQQLWGQMTQPERQLAIKLSQ